MAAPGMEILYSCVQSQLKSPGDALVCCLHWGIVKNGYKCIGKGEQTPSTTDDKKRSEMLPANWNNDQTMYTLLYWPNNSTDTHLLKVIPLDGSLLVHFMRLKDEKVSQTEFLVEEYTTGDLSTYESAYKNLQELQIRFEQEIIDGFGEEQKDKSKASTSSQAAKEKPRDQRREEDDPLRIPPRQPTHTRPTPEWVDPEGPFAIGRGDLDPLAAGRGGGMLMDPGRFGRMPRGDPSAGLPGRLPRGAVPPGARFDPFGPPGPGPGRGPAGGGFGAGPDPDHLPPPGYDDMFM